MTLPVSGQARSKSLRAALLGAVALVAIGGVALESVPLASHAATSSAGAPAIGPSSFADVVDRVKGAVVSVKVKIADDGSESGPPCRRCPISRPAARSTASSSSSAKAERRRRYRPASGVTALRISRWRRAPASSFPPTAISSPTTTSSITPPKSRSRRRRQDDLGQGDRHRSQDRSGAAEGQRRRAIIPSSISPASRRASAIG